MHYSVIAEPLVDLGDAVDLADIAARITAHAANIPAGQWIMATPVGEPHYFLRRSYRDLTQGQLPDRTIMDAAAPNPPVFIQAWAPVIPNTCVLNTAGLRRLGVTRDAARNRSDHPVPLPGRKRRGLKDLQRVHGRGWRWPSQ
jgi:predicted amidohydrolase YtcJ